MRDINFQNKLKDYIQNVLNKITIIPSTNQLCSNIRISEFKTRWGNGDLLKHSNGIYYAIAIFEAIPKASVNKIKEFMKTSDFTMSELIDFVNEQKLTKYISCNTNAYVNWQKGDIGSALMIFDQTKKTYKIDGFSNHSALNRNTPIREKPYLEEEESNEDFQYADRSFSFNDEFYNDSLDIDQQDPEFWDS